MVLVGKKVWGVRVARHGNAVARQEAGGGLFDQAQALRADAAELHAADLCGGVLEGAAAVGADHALSSMNDSAISCTASGVRCGQ